MKRSIDPLISILIVMVAFMAVTLLILQGETALNNQISASIFNPQRFKTMEISECLDNAYNDFLTNWNQVCKAERLEEKCSLDKDVAEPLKSTYQKSQNNCY